MPESPVSLEARFPGCSIAPDANIGKDVSIGFGTVVHGAVEIGDGTVIQEHCVIGTPSKSATTALQIGHSSIIRSHSVLYQGSSLGPYLETGHHTVIRERTVAGDNLRVGNFSDIEGDCTIGDFCRFHGYVHVGKGSRIGHFVWLFSLTTTTNDPMPPSNLDAPVTLEDGVVVCVGVTLMPGTIVRQGAFISASAAAQGEIPAGAVVAGSEGRIVSHVSRLIHMASGVRHPWMRHFKEAYPERAHARIEALLDDVMKSKATLKLQGVENGPK